MEYKLWNGNCLELMSDIEDKSVDMILCDLPYGTTNCKWDNILPFEEMWLQYNRVIKDKGAIVLFATQPFTSALIMSNVDMFKYCWTWDKCIGRGHLVAKIRPLQRTEDICVFGKGLINYFPIMEERDKPVKGKEGKRTDIMGGESTGYEQVYTHKYPQTLLSYPIRIKKEDRVHPTQKPVSLLEYLIKTYTQENEWVLDNTMGSGSTELACQDTNRNFIGIEQNEEYYNIAQRRMGTNTYSTTNLFRAVQ